jgi:hypothetical protein
VTAGVVICLPGPTSLGRALKPRELDGAFFALFFALAIMTGDQPGVPPLVSVDRRGAVDAAGWARR